MRYPDHKLAVSGIWMCQDHKLTAYVSDRTIAGGFTFADNIFKSLVLGTP